MAIDDSHVQAVTAAAGVVGGLALLQVAWFIYSRVTALNAHVPIVAIIVWSCIPIAIITAFITIVAPIAGPYLEAVRNASEGICLFFFMTLIKHYLKVASEKANTTPEGLWKTIPAKQVFSVPPLGCWYRLCEKPSVRSFQFLIGLRKGLSIYALTFSIIGTIQIVMSAQGYNPGLGVAAVETIVMMVALYFVFMGYFLLHDILHEYTLTRKFIALKFGVFIMTVQRLIINIIVSDEESAVQLNAYLIVFEFSIMALVQTWAYPPHEFLRPKRASVPVVQAVHTHLRSNKKVILWSAGLVFMMAGCACIWGAAHTVWEKSPDCVNKTGESYARCVLSTPPLACQLANVTQEKLAFQGCLKLWPALPSLFEPYLFDDMNIFIGYILQVIGFLLIPVFAGFAVFSEGAADRPLRMVGIWYSVAQFAFLFLLSSTASWSTGLRVRILWEDWNNGLVTSLDSAAPLVVNNFYGGIICCWIGGILCCMAPLRIASWKTKQGIQQFMPISMGLALLFTFIGVVCANTLEEANTIGSFIKQGNMYNPNQVGVLIGLQKTGSTFLFQLLLLVVATVSKSWEYAPILVFYFAYITWNIVPHFFSAIGNLRNPQQWQAAVFTGWVGGWFMVYAAVGLWKGRSSSVSAPTTTTTTSTDAETSIPPTHETTETNTDASPESSIILTQPETNIALTDDFTETSIVLTQPEKSATPADAGSQSGAADAESVV